MAQWKYTCEAIGTRPKSLTFGFKLETDHWTKFGTLYVPFDMFQAYHLQPLIAHWTRRMEGPPEEDTPLFGTEQ